MKAEDGIWPNLKTENTSVALKRPDLLYFMVDFTKVVKIEKFGILSSIFENLCTENENR